MQLKIALLTLLLSTMTSYLFVILLICIIGLSYGYQPNPIRPIQVVVKMPTNFFRAVLNVMKPRTRLSQLFATKGKFGFAKAVARSSPAPSTMSPPSVSPETGTPEVPPVEAIKEIVLEKSKEIQEIPKKDYYKGWTPHYMTLKQWPMH